MDKMSHWAEVRDTQNVTCKGFVAEIHKECLTSTVRWQTAHLQERLEIWTDAPKNCKMANKPRESAQLYIEVRNYEQKDRNASACLLGNKNAKRWHHPELARALLCGTNPGKKQTSTHLRQETDHKQNNNTTKVHNKLMSLLCLIPAAWVTQRHLRHWHLTPA